MDILLLGAVVFTSGYYITQNQKNTRNLKRKGQLNKFDDTIGKDVYYSNELNERSPLTIDLNYNYDKDGNAIEKFTTDDEYKKESVSVNFSDAYYNTYANYADAYNKSKEEKEVDIAENNLKISSYDKKNANEYWNYDENVIGLTSVDNGVNFKEFTDKSEFTSRAVAPGATAKIFKSEPHLFPVNGETEKDYTVVSTPKQFTYSPGEVGFNRPDKQFQIDKYQVATPGFKMRTKDQELSRPMNYRVSKNNHFVPTSQINNNANYNQQDIRLKVTDNSYLYNSNQKSISNKIHNSHDKEYIVPSNFRETTNSFRSNATFNSFKREDGKFTPSYNSKDFIVDNANSSYQIGNLGDKNPNYNFSEQRYKTKNDRLIFSTTANKNINSLRSVKDRTLSSRSERKGTDLLNTENIKKDIYRKDNGLRGTDTRFRNSEIDMNDKLSLDIQHVNKQLEGLTYDYNFL